MIEIKVFFDEFDMFEDKPLYEYIMRYLMRTGIRGATVIEGRFGFGKKHKLHSPHTFGNTDESPMIIMFIDEKDKVDKVLPHIKEVVNEGIIVATNVDFIQ